MLKNIWNDPVWSKVIASVIIAGAGWLTYRLNWWPGWMTRRIAGLWISFWTYLSSASAIPHWLLILLILIAVPTIVVAAVLMWVAIFQKNPAPGVATESHWT